MFVLVKNKVPLHKVLYCQRHTETLKATKDNSFNKQNIISSITKMQIIGKQCTQETGEGCCFDYAEKFIYDLNMLEPVEMKRHVCQVKCVCVYHLYLSLDVGKCCSGPCETRVSSR